MADPRPNDEHGVSHDRADESLEAKVRWFQSLTVQERMDLLCEMTDLALAANPDLPDQKHAEPVPGRICVLELPRG
ncbi:MAG: hypothetical protein DWQ34_23350 [Planctomycetota bacterium]|nr:MAG: hypothetical protein DWQ29_13955 [Planctomycetota bacterium]REJ88066.1 MAG: hypothetical protein DWQ34_23350 [Planctomycetota bacterium]REK24187.1 MAG: hypothetical protein DWQ41_14200 [Planctomycetota bacterium]REK28825.1 MAG: hypothetical protein DWQ45_24315 [Planctomycetota bacterium]